MVVDAGEGETVDRATMVVRTPPVATPDGVVGTLRRVRMSEAEIMQREGQKQQQQHTHTHIHEFIKLLFSRLSLMPSVGHAFGE